MFPRIIILLPPFLSSHYCPFLLPLRFLYSPSLFHPVEICIIISNIYFVTPNLTAFVFPIGGSNLNEDEEIEDPEVVLLLEGSSGGTSAWVFCSSTTFVIKLSVYFLCFCLGYLGFWDAKEANVASSWIRGEILKVHCKYHKSYTVMCICSPSSLRGIRCWYLVDVGLILSLWNILKGSSGANS